MTHDRHSTASDTIQSVVSQRSNLFGLLTAAAGYVRSTPAPWYAAIDDLLGAIGNALGGDRVSIMERRPALFPAAFERRCAWAAPAHTPGTAEAALLFTALSQSAATTDDAQTTFELRAADMLDAATAEAPPLVAWKALAAPIAVTGQRWGYLACERWSDPRGWIEAEHQALEAVATLLGAAIERGQITAALAVSEEQTRLIARATHDVIWDCNVITKELRWSGAVETMFGYSVGDVWDPTWWDERVHPEDYTRVVGGLNSVLEGGGDVWSDEYRFRCGDQSYVTVIDRGYVLRDTAGAPIRVIGSMMDITERKTLEEQLAFQASHDALTGMPNRALFVDRLQQALARAARKQTAVAVLFLDLDRFKVINDSLGHIVGDELLVATAARMRDCLRAEDTAARLGGDEFTVLLEQIADANDAILIADRINRALEEPFVLAGHEIVISTSIGIALSSPLDTPTSLLRNADVAMYRAKSNGKACYELFDPTMNERALDRLKLEAELRHALQRDELCVYYQPKVNLATGALIGMEALVRWLHPERGVVPPLEFIPLAEETGLILPLEQWVMHEACRQGQRWRETYPDAPPFCMSVNVSVSRFKHRSLVAEIAATLAETGFPAANLILEITESVVMENAKSNIETLRDLKRLGVQLAIDDFGTGYSSLSYLKRFPVDLLKIDRAFVARLGQVAEDTAIVQAIVTLAHALELQVVAEGIETAAQMEQLQTLGCEFGQGFMVARPMTAEVAASYLRPGSLVPQGDLLPEDALIDCAPLPLLGAALT